ncbi:MAG: class I SAM-dependent RNA methyltransferase [Bacteriovoracaceae bacterium]|nr:class I SAM-dependent RNA methyltransferase [Bacteriovoracaceae bacterium]
MHEHKKFKGIVRGYSSKGLGVVTHPDGRVFFVQGCVRGDEGIFEEKSFTGKFGFADFKELTQKSPWRIESHCPHQGFLPKMCGGCPWMMMDYQEQLWAKMNRVESAFRKAGLKTNISPIQAAPQTFNYRNRASLKTNGKEIGYVSTASNILAPIKTCIILTEKNQETLKQIMKSLPRDDFKTGEGEWNFLEIDEDTDYSQVKLNTHLPFKQGNTQQNIFMQNWVKEKLEGIASGKKILELFCGSGNFTQILADLNFSEICAVEGDKKAVEKLKHKNLKDTQVFVADLFKKDIADTLASFITSPQILLLDPPRDGMKEIASVVEKFSSLEKIISISCDPETCARDLKKLVESGWQIEEVLPLDQFPHTPHVEILATLKKIKHNRE